MAGLAMALAAAVPAAGSIDDATPLDVTAHPAAAPPAIRSDAFILRLPTTSARARPPLAIERAAGDLGARLEPEFPNDVPPFSEFWIVHLDPGVSVEQAIGRFATLEGVGDAFPIARVPALAIPNDSLWSAAWYFRQPSRHDVHAPEAWDVTTGDTSIVVAITDTGVLPEHPDLAGQFHRNGAEAAGLPGIDDDGNGYVDDVQGWDFVDLPPSIEVRFGEDGQVEDNDPSDFAGHGTAVAGVIGARTNNRIGVAGTAWRVGLMPLRIGWSSPAYPSGEGDVSYIARAIRYATRMGARVVNCSFMTTRQPDLEAATDAAIAAGVTIVTAAGNFGVSHYLAQREDVISVTATDQDDRVAAWATTGPQVDLAAPGNRIASTTVDRDSLGHRFPDYTTGASGTSFSSPMVAGAVALMAADRRAHGLPPLSPFGTLLRLTDTADDIGDLNVGGAGHGTGRLDLLRALTDPPMSRVALAGAVPAGTPVLLPGSGPKTLVIATKDGRLIVIDGVSGAIEAQVALGATPVGGVAAASLENDRVGLFVATIDQRIHGFDTALRRLEGWPVAVAVNPASVTREPALGDVDGDGRIEVVWGGGGDGLVRVWHANGTPLSGFPARAGYGDLGIALSDLDQVPGVEIVAGGEYVTVMRANGSIAPGWPRVLGSPFPPAVAGMGRSRRPAVIVAGSDRIDAIGASGENLWTRLVGVIQAPVAADIDGDGGDEIVLIRSSPTTLAALDSTGADAAIWTPAALPTGTFLGPALVAPLGGARLDAILAHATRGLLAFRANGLPLRSFPKPGGGMMAPLIGDLDSDGATDVFAASSSDTTIFFYELPRGTWNYAPSTWATARANASRTGSTLYAPELSSADTLRPAAVTDLAIRSTASGRVELVWHAPADVTGYAVTRYDVRYSTQPIDAGNVYLARSAGGLPAPLAPGTLQSAIVSGLDESVSYYFAIRGFGSNGHWSAPSNLVVAETPPFLPDPVTDLRQSARTDTSFTVAWTATGDDGRVGRPAAYRFGAATGPIDSSSFDLAPYRWEVVANGSAGAAETATLRGLPAEGQFSVAMVAVDDRGNVSRLSNAVEITTRMVGPAPVADLAVTSRNDVSAVLEWTASGDDGREGHARGYEVRMSRSPFDDTSIDGSRILAEIVATRAAGGHERVVMNGLDPDVQQFIALVTIDPRGNRSSLSNRVSVVTLAEPVPFVAFVSLQGQTDDQVTLHWRNPSDGLFRVSGFRLRAATEPLTEATFDAAEVRADVASGVGPGGTEHATLAGLEPGAHYWIAVAALDTFGLRSRISNPVEATMTPIPPARVADLRSAGRTDTSFTLQWSASGDDGSLGMASYYRIHATESAIDSYGFANAPHAWDVPAHVEGGRPETVTLEGLPPDGMYQVALVAIDDRGNASAISNSIAISTARVAPAAVTDFTVTGLSDTRVGFAWTASGDDGRIGRPLEYELRVATEPFDSSTIELSDVHARLAATRAAGGAERPIVGGFTRGILYYAALVAIDRAGLRSGLSNRVSFRTLESSLPPIANLEIELRTDDSLSVIWQSPPNPFTRIVRYRLHASTEPLTDSTFDAAPIQREILASPVIGAYEKAVFRNLELDRHYWIGLIAVDSLGTISPLSNVVEVTTVPFPPAPVHDLRVASFTNTVVTVQWVATGEDDARGRPATYQIRAAEEPIDSTVFASATLRWNTPARVDAGGLETAILSGFQYERRYWIAVTATDRVGNVSTLSNVAEFYLADTPPDPVVDLRVVQRFEQRVVLTWSATGNDGRLGKPGHYLLRAAQEPIDSAVFERAPIQGVVQARVAPIGTETLPIGELARTSTWWFALRAVDTTGHVSPLSNVATATLVSMAPSRIIDMRLLSVADTMLRFAFTAAGDDGRNGTARVFHFHGSETRMTDSTFAHAPYAWQVTPSVPGGRSQTVAFGGFPKNKHLYFAVAAEDSAGNLAPISNQIEVTTTQVPPDRITSLRFVSSSPRAITLQWGAAGEDGPVGRCTRYLVHAARAPLDWASFESAPMRWEVRPGGTWSEGATLIHPDLEGPLWFAVVAEDRAVNRSPVSNNVEASFPSIPPAPATGLELIDRSGDAVTLSWTASGGDGLEGRPRAYLVRAAESPMDSLGFESALLRWEIRPTVDGGLREQATLDGLDPARVYWFAIVAEDGAGNRSPISELLDVTTPTRAPWAVRGLSALPRASGVRLAWSAPAGGPRPVGYRVAVAESPLDDARFDAATLRWELEPTPGAHGAESADLELAGERRYWIAVAALLADGSRSPISEVASVWVGRLAEGTGAAIAVERQPAIAPVRLLWRTSNAGPARFVAIYDVRGRLVRTGNLEGPRQGVWVWDGRDRGGSVAPPGLYFARLSEGSKVARARIVLLH
jgi:subtilisin family serine protease/chitodextrinase